MIQSCTLTLRRANISAVESDRDERLRINHCRSIIFISFHLFESDTRSIETNTKHRKRNRKRDRQKKTHTHSNDLTITFVIITGDYFHLKLAEQSDCKSI